MQLHIQTVREKQIYDVVLCFIRCKRILHYCSPHCIQSFEYAKHVQACQLPRTFSKTALYFTYCSRSWSLLWAWVGNRTFLSFQKLHNLCSFHLMRFSNDHFKHLWKSWEFFFKSYNHRMGPFVSEFLNYYLHRMFQQMFICESGR